GLEFRRVLFRSFLDALRAHNVSLVVADVAGKFPTTEDITADWVYVRLHGSRRLYQSGYGPKELDAWAQKVRAWHDGREPPDARRICPPAPRAPQGRDVFVFFDNTDVKLRAPVDARSFARTLGVGPTGTVPQVLNELGLNAKK